MTHLTGDNNDKYDIVFCSRKEERHNNIIITI